MKQGVNGVTAKTPQNIAFGAGTYHKGLKYTPGVSGAAGSWNFTESCIGATKGGGGLEIVPEIYEVEPDGFNVSGKELTVKTGETAIMKVTMLEVTKDLIKAAVIGDDGTSQDTTYDQIVSKPDIEVGDYWENIAFVGKTLGGKNIIVILPNALCTSGFNLEGQAKETGTVEYEFKCHADLTSDGDHLPYEIYYPKATA